MNKCHDEKVTLTNTASRQMSVESSMRVSGKLWRAGNGKSDIMVNQSDYQL